MKSLDSPSMAMRLDEATEKERFELLREGARRPESARALREAHLLLCAAREGVQPDPSDSSDSMDPMDPIDDAELALALAQGRVPRAVCHDWEALEWVLNTLSPDDDAEDELPSASGSTRRAMRRVTRPASGRRSWQALWLPAFGTAGAALLVAVMWSPAPDPWGRSLGLSRFRAMQLSGELAEDVRAAVENGRVSEPVFELPLRPSGAERDSSGSAVPEPLAPRWEAVPATHPVFRWTAPHDADDGIVVLDANRRVVWEAEATEPGRLAYPADAPAMEPGATYFWKINRSDSNRLVASPYVAFRVLDRDSRARLEAELRSAGSHPFLQGTAYDRYGLLTPAAEAFGRAAVDNERLRDAAIRIRGRVRVKQGFRE